MTDEWTPLAVNFWRDPKVAGTSKDAKLLALGGFTYCQGQGTDGFIPTGALAIIAAETGANRSAVSELTGRRLWVETADGWAIPSWLEWNKPAAEVEAERNAKGRGAKLGNHKRWHVERGVRQPGCRFCESDTDQLPITDRSDYRIRPDSPPSPSPSHQSFSQSSGSSSGPPPEEEDEDDPKVTAVAGVLGARDHQRRLDDPEMPPVKNRTAHLRACISRRLDEARTAAAAHPDATVDELVEIIEPPPKPERANPHVRTWEETQAAQAAEAAEYEAAGGPPTPEQRIAAIEAAKAAVTAARRHQPEGDTP